MDTIVLVHSYTHDDPLFTHYEMLSMIRPPTGCKTWNSTIERCHARVCWVKINCHDIIGLQTPSTEDVDHLRAHVDSYLGAVSLSVNDFNLSRVDYDFNFYLDAHVSEALIDAMQSLPPRAMRMDKLNVTDSVYYQCKSRHAQLYCKDVERAAKGYVVKVWENGLCRQEVQCHAAHIKYMRGQYGVLRTWDNWVTVERENHYLTTAKSIFPPGDFCTLAAAQTLIDLDANLTPYFKRRLMEVLGLIQQQGMGTLLEKYCRNTIKRYLNQLKPLNINPLTIRDSFGIDFIENPFRKKAQTGGADNV